MTGWPIIRSTSLTALLITTTCLVRVVTAQEPPTTVDDPPVASEAEVVEADEGSKPPPSLDDLLDLEGGEASTSDEAAAELERRRTLDAALAEQQPEQAFRVAVTEMLESVDLLRDRRSTGLGTQRVQERIVDRLQVLIDSAQKQRQQQQQQQSGSSASQQQQDPGRRSQQQQGQEGRDAAEQQGRNDGDNQDGSSTQAPPPESTTLEGVLDESQVEWGSLPPRVRELITQGMRDQMSQLYRSLTEAYYRRMAEEADR